jgi:hypothetical protein
MSRPSKRLLRLGSASSGVANILQGAWSDVFATSRFLFSAKLRRPETESTPTVQ